jgi:aspartate/methionine/tyrosine aminotransferase
MFSSRLQSDLTPNRLAEAIARLRRERRPILDLTESNPTRAELEYAPDLLAPLSNPRALEYAPEPLGLSEARTAVAADYARRGVAIDPDRIALTASTSEAYSLLFKVLADPGGEVMVPRPSYPLFEHLTRLDGVLAVPYDLEYHGLWSIDFASVERALTARTRAILLVSPNNPTGSFVKREELGRLSALAAGAGIALLADEVFADYPLEPDALARAGQPLTLRDGLVFSLGGLSKTIGLPQVKLGWIAAAGQHESAGRAMTALELACDTYLSVSTPVQAAAGELLDHGAAVRRQIQTRIASNHRRLAARVASMPACRLLPAEGGWYGVVQVPSLCSEEDLVLDLLLGAGVLVHPGYFFDFPRESYVIVSLLTPEPQFDEGIGRMLSRAESRQRPLSVERP